MEILSTLVDIAGILGFLLSLILAILEFSKKRLKMSVSDIVFINADIIQNSVFLKFRITNMTLAPFCIKEISIKSGKNVIFMDHTVRTFTQKRSGNILGVKPVVFSQAFPVQFDSYAVKEFLIELPRLKLSEANLHPDVKAHSQEELICSRPHGIRNLCTHRHLPRIVFYTSRGPCEAPLLLSSIREQDFLEEYVVRKAGYEGKIVFE